MNNALREFQHWLWDVTSPSTFKYYEGFLARDRWSNWKLDQPTVNVPVDRLAKEVWDAYASGFVHLTQERLGDEHYLYYATKVIR